MLKAAALDVLERLVEATYTRDRRRHLLAANLGIEKLRFLCRLAKDLGLLDERLHRPHLRQPGGQGDAPGRGPLRARARPAPPRAAMTQPPCCLPF